MYWYCRRSSGNRHILIEKYYVSYEIRFHWHTIAKDLQRQRRAVINYHLVTSAILYYLLNIMKFIHKVKSITRSKIKKKKDFLWFTAWNGIKKQKQNKSDDTKMTTLSLALNILWPKQFNKQNQWHYIRVEMK